MSQGMHLATNTYMKRELKPRLSKFRTKISELNQAEQDMRHRMLTISSISTQLGLKKDDNEDWKNLEEQYANLHRQKNKNKAEEEAASQELDRLVDILQHSKSKEEYMAILRKSLCGEKYQNTGKKGGRKATRKAKRKTKRKAKRKSKRKDKRKTKRKKKSKKRIKEKFDELWKMKM